MRRRVLSGCLVSAITTALCALALEAGTRWYVRRQGRPGARPSAAMQLDDRLGWRPMPSFRRSGERADLAGHRYRVETRVDADGFRRYRMEQPRGRLLVIGDSYTWAVDAGDDATYYALLHRDLRMDVDAFGCGGYGTLQEFMVLDDCFDRVHPTAVLLQMCRNDLVNNSYALEARSRINNNSMRRPYLAPDGAVAYAFPCGFPRRLPALRDFANRRSTFLYFLFSRVDRRLAASGVSVESLYEQDDPEAARLYAEAMDVTGRLLHRVRDRVPAGVPVFAFCTDDIEPYTAGFRRIASEAGLLWVDGVAQAVAQARERGEVVQAADGWHWNPRGHELAAGVLAPALRAALDARPAATPPR